MRFSPFVALVLGAVLVVLSLAPSVRAQGTPALDPITDFRVTAVDTDGNGKYDALVGTFNATVTVAGNFRFAAYAMAYYGYTVARNNTDLNLPVGTHALSVSIPGPWIHQAGFNGPYDFQLTVYPVTDQGYMSYFGFSADAYTPAYNATDFEPPWAYIGSPIIDAGVDSDGNGLYNALVVHVPVVVNRTTYVQIQGYLGGYYSGFYSLPTEPLYLTPGTHTLDLTWDGMLLRTSTSFIPGTQTVVVQLVLPKLLSGYYAPVIASATSVTTHSYASSQFERPSAYFSSPTITTTTEDTNGNGLADFLVFHLPITVRVAGDYGLIVAVQGGGTGGSGLPEGAKMVHLDPGNTTVDVRVSGIALSRLTSYSFLANAMVVHVLSTTYGDRDVLTWSLSGVQPSSFESRSVSTLTVYTAPSPNGTYCAGYAWDPTNRYLASASGGYTGNLQFPLYDGTFYIVALGCTSASSVAVRKVTVSGSMSVAVNATAMGTLDESIQVNVPSWNSTAVRASASLGGASALYRLIADFYGNADGSADAAELDHIAEVLTSGSLYIGPYGMVREDNRSLAFLSRFTASLSGPGDITSSSPLSYSTEYLAITTNPPIPGDHHRLILELPYSDLEATVSVTISLGASVGGNLSMVSRMMAYDGDGFTWPANATVTKTGPRSWTIDVGQVPPNEPRYVQLEVVVDAYGTPAPTSPSLLDYVTNPLAITLIVVAVAVVAFALLARRKKGAAPPSPPPT